MGLSIVEGIVQEHQGRVWVESEYGKGSTIPCCPSDSSKTIEDKSEMREDEVYKVTEFEHKPDQKAAIRNEDELNLLVTDDDEDAISVTQKLLADKYDVSGANANSIGLKTGIDSKPDPNLRDAWMPGISGYDVCKTLKGNVNTKNIPIITVTAAIQKEDEERARDVGADGFISKPLKKEDMIGLIEGFRNKEWLDDMEESLSL